MKMHVLDGVHGISWDIMGYHGIQTKQCIVQISEYELSDIYILYRRISWDTNNAFIILNIS